MQTVGIRDLQTNPVCWQNRWKTMSLSWSPNGGSLWGWLPLLRMIFCDTAFGKSGFESIWKGRYFTLSTLQVASTEQKWNDEASISAQYPHYGLSSRGRSERDRVFLSVRIDGDNHHPPAGGYDRCIEGQGKQHGCSVSVVDQDDTQWRVAGVGGLMCHWCCQGANTCFCIQINGIGITRPLVSSPDPLFPLFPLSPLFLGFWLSVRVDEFEKRYKLLKLVRFGFVMSFIVRVSSFQMRYLWNDINLSLHSKAGAWSEGNLVIFFMCRWVRVDMYQKIMYDDKSITQRIRYVCGWISSGHKEWCRSYT